MLLPLIFLALALASTRSVSASLNPLDVTKVHNPLQARSGATGCTCDGFSWAISSIQNGTSYIVLFPYGSKYQNNNTLGWCFQDGVMTAASQNLISTAIYDNVATDYVNTTWAWTDCETPSAGYVGTTNPATCTSHLVSTFSAALLGSSGTSTTYLAQCSYPSSNFIPTDCQCGFECVNGYEKCGTQNCYDPTTQTCSSGVPVSNSRRRRSMSCPAGTSVCPSKWGGGWECLNTEDDIEACGGCPNQEGSVDCTTIEGVSEVRCVSGQCHADSCEPGYQVNNGECTPKILDSKDDSKLVFRQQ